MNKKSISKYILILLLVLSFSLTACTASDNKKESKAKKQVTVTTSFLYDMVDVLAGDLVDKVLIMPAGEDPHLYILKPKDTEKITEADLLLYHGLHFEGKMVEILEKYGVAVSTDFPQEKIGEMDEDGAIVVDPHFWFDISLYRIACEKAASSLSELLPDESKKIQENLANYLEELDKLDQYIKDQIAKIPEENRYLVTPHDAYNYFSRAYNIEVVAPQGISTDSEVANSDLDASANFIVEHKIPAIFAESTTDPARMEKLKELCTSKGFEVKVVSGDDAELFSDSLAPEGQKGDNYLDMYKHNVDLIVENLLK